MVQTLDARGRAELPCCDLPRQARSDLVGGQDRARARRGDARHPRPGLPRGRAHPGRPRTAVRPARVPAHLARHGARHGLGARHHGSVERRRPLERCGRRRNPPGTGAAERTGALRVAQPRPCRDRRVPRADQHGHPVRLLPHQLDRARRGRQLPRLRPQHLGDLQIDRGSGNIIWRLGGKKSDFAIGPGTVFAWQHDARHHGATDQLVSLFDDGAAPQVQPQSKALVLALDTKRMRASVHRKYTHHPPVLSHALGSTQLLPNGNVLVGWGTAPWLSEYTHGGESCSTLTCRSAARTIVC